MNTAGDLLRGRRVFLTGHTGFKGSWMLLWLARMGAEVTGYSLEAPADSMYAQLELGETCHDIAGDVRDREHLVDALEAARPEIVFHMAAQSLVLASYDDPLGTLQTNIFGTANLLDAIRTTGLPCIVIVVTSDKCYENRGWLYGYRETDPLGGHDIYSASKAAAELVAASYRRSFFPNGDAVRVATVRAGNVIGGGDRADGRIVPDCIRALGRSEPIQVRNPRFVRPWQHVLEPLHGYLMLGAGLLAGRSDLCDAWNFGPQAEDVRTVEELVEAVIGAWGSGRWINESREQPHEAHTLRLCVDKALVLLGWSPRWTFADSVSHTIAWYRASHDGATAAGLRALSFSQIETYERGAAV